MLEGSLGKRHMATLFTKKKKKTYGHLKILSSMPICNSSRSEKQSTKPTVKINIIAQLFQLNVIKVQYHWK